MIIASAKKVLSGNLKQNRQTYLIVLFIALAVVGISFFFLGEFAIFLLLGIFFVVPLIMHINSLKEVLPFVAWVDNGELHFDYYTKDENNNKERHLVSFLLQSIRAYTVHSFLKGTPAFIEITFDTGYQMGKSKPIYIEELSGDEANKLTSFLDSLMIKRKKMEGQKQQTITD